MAAREQEGANRRVQGVEKDAVSSRTLADGHSTKWPDEKWTVPTEMGRHHATRRFRT